MRKETKQIGGATYHVETYNVVTGREALVRLQRMFGPAMGELIEGRGKTGIARALGDLSGRFAVADLEWFVAKTAEKTAVEHADGRLVPMRPDVQEDLFAGNYLTMFEWLEFALEVNFKDFLGLLRSMVKPADDAPTAPSKSA